MRCGAETSSGAEGRSNGTTGLASPLGVETSGRPGWLLLGPPGYGEAATDWLKKEVRQHVAGELRVVEYTPCALFPGATSGTVSSWII
ncbi:hypothetical protein NDU88_001845 [Pleurodeles waltl]|uniref:Uncharacterized protein n=1 Tax=Pleurodeles waltl TaxID=8319 RepID=A0AAV7UUH3_PLEWA|nr:hypothetical protein NDU88_001845 [Pleurodeles waltl]